jgi:hypothetical protein
MPLERGVVPFVPWDMDGLDATLEVRSAPGSGAVVHLRARDPDGDVRASTEIAVDDRGQADLDVEHLVNGAPGHGWVDYVSHGDLDVELDWQFRGGSAGVWKGEASAVTRFDTSGPGSGVAGALVAIVNPTDAALTYRMTRTIGGQIVNDEQIDVQPQTQIVRLYRSRTDRDISLTVRGGPFVVQVVRWDPLERFLG